MLVKPHKLINPLFSTGFMSNNVAAPVFDGTNDALFLASAFPNSPGGANGEFMLSVWVYPLNGMTTGALYFCGGNLA